jgi:NADPH:quinone reductase-like Zn-dependent oxidoreductase
MFLRTLLRRKIDNNLKINNKFMKAAIYTEYGAPEVVKIKEVAKPVPGDNEILIKIHATTITAGDWRARSLKMPDGFGLFGPLAFGINGPRQPILGMELAGVIESIGKDVTQFKVGDEVFAFVGIKMGCHAEYRTMPADGPVAKKPQNLSFEEAAALSFGGTTALYFLRKANIKKGDKVLINGASGCVGTATAQLAKYYGATVTGVCSAGNFELVKSLGATKVIDYTKEDFASNGETYDVIVDTVGNAPFSRVEDSLKSGGRLLRVLGSVSDLLPHWLPDGKKIISGSGPELLTDLVFLAQLAAEGVYKPVIDRVYALEEIVEAHRYVDAGHKKGNVVIKLV